MQIGSARCARSVRADDRSQPLVRCIVALALSARAVARRAARADDDLPGRVGRIAESPASSILAPEDAPSDWAPIGLNYPVTSGDNLWCRGDGRAEVDYGGGQFRLAGDTNLHVSRLDDRQLALFVAQGRVIVRVRVLDPGESARIDTPDTQIALTRPGLYRIDVAPDRQVDDGQSCAKARRRSVSLAARSRCCRDRRRP